MNETVAEIGGEGASALNDALKVNTTLTAFGIRCAMQEINQTKLNVTNTCVDSGDEDAQVARALSETLKVNTTLTALDLLGMLRGSETSTS